MMFLVIPWILFSFTTSWTYFGSWLAEVERLSQLRMSGYGLEVLNLAGLVGGSMKAGWRFGWFSWLPAGPDENISATAELLSARCCSFNDINNKDFFFK